MPSTHLILPSAHLILRSAHLIMCSAHLIIRQRCSMSRGCASKGKLTSWGLHRRSATADARGLHTQPQKVQVGWSDFTQRTESTGGFVRLHTMHRKYRWVCQTSHNAEKVQVGFVRLHTMHRKYRWGLDNTQKIQVGFV